MCEREKHTRTVQLYIIFYYIQSRVYVARHRRMSTQFRIRLFSTTRYGNGIRRVCVLRICASPLNYTINCHRDNIVSSLERPSLISVEFYFFSPLLYIISFSTMCTIFFPAVIVYYVCKCPNLETFFFSLRGKRVSISICASSCPRDCCIYNWSRVIVDVHQKIKITDRSVLCGHKRNKYNNAFDIMAIISKVYANYYGAWNCI